MHRLVDTILNFPPGIVLLLAFFLPLAEASLFIGVIFPGEIAILFGGVLANEHRLSLFAVIAAGSLGAIVGDNIGYRIGRHYGERLLARIPRRLVKPETVERGQELLRRRGGLAVFVGRFTASLRALIPGLAGASKIPYRTFLIFNIAGGVLWATAVALLGYVAGRSYHAAEHRATQIGIALLAVVALLVFVKIISSRYRAVLGRASSIPYRSWVAARLDPTNPFGRPLTIALVLIGGAAWFFGGIVQDVLQYDGIAPRDPGLLDAVIAYRSNTFTSVATVVSLLGSPWLVYGLLILVGLAFWGYRNDYRLPLFVLGTLASGDVVAYLVGIAIHRSRPPHELWLVAKVSGFSFPSFYTINVTIGYGLIAFLLFQFLESSWTRILVAIPVMMLVLSIGFSQSYLGVHWPSDVLSGWAFGALWLSLALTVAYFLRHTEKPVL